jgi:CPA2 family monovalent cation:H+ antiporter-2
MRYMGPTIALTMHDTPEFLKALTIVLGVAAVTTVAFQRLRQPVVLGYIIAGLIVGPHVPIPLVADSAAVQTLSELGVILLMFSLGLEFSIRKLVQVAPTAGLTAVLQSSIMVWLGFVVGQLFGWTTLESLFAGAVIAISSTTIIAKAFDEQGITGKLREVVVGILIVEDLIAILLIAILTGVASGSGLSAGPLAATIGRLAAFLIVLVSLGLLFVPRIMRAVGRLNRRETTLVASVGLCFAIALLARSFGYSVALGAFIAGSLVAESGEEEHVKQLVEPVRDVFAAIFFVSVGMLIDPALVAEHWPAVAVLTAVVVLGKVFGVSLGAFLGGAGMRTSVQAGMSLAQIGEFSFIIAGLGLSLNATGEFLYPVAVAVSALTTLSTPWLIRASGPVAAWVDRKLPKPLQTFAALYGSWIEELRSVPRADTAIATIRRLLRLLVLDGAALAGIIVGTSAGMRTVVAFARDTAGIPEELARLLVIGAAIALAAPFCVGVIRVGRRLGLTVARVALPAHKGKKVDFAAAPRRAFVVTLQLASVMLVGAPLLALTQPFLPSVPGAAVLALSLAVLGVAFWQSATNLQGHVRAGAQVIVEALAAQSRGRGIQADAQALEQVHELLPGLGALVAVRLDPGSAAIGKTLAELNLRGLTGATVLAITRGEGGVIIPSATEVLRAGDVLALAGTHEAIEAAKNLVTAPPLSVSGPVRD